MITKQQARKATATRQMIPVGKAERSVNPLLVIAGAVGVWALIRPDKEDTQPESTSVPKPSSGWLEEYGEEIRSFEIELADVLVVSIFQELDCGIEEIEDFKAAADYLMCYGELERKGDYLNLLEYLKTCNEQVSIAYPLWQVLHRYFKGALMSPLEDLVIDPNPCFIFSLRHEKLFLSEKAFPLYKVRYGDAALAEIQTAYNNKEYVQTLKVLADLLALGHIDISLISLLQTCLNKLGNKKAVNKINHLLADYYFSLSKVQKEEEQKPWGSDITWQNKYVRIPLVIFQT